MFGLTKKVQQVEVEPVSNHVAGSGGGREHAGGRGVVPREEAGLHLQSKSEGERLALPLHLGEDHAPPREQRRRSRQIQGQSPSQIHGRSSSCFKATVWGIQTDL